MNVLLFASNFYLMGKKHPEPQYWCQMVSVCTVRCLTVCLCCFLQVSQLDWRSRIITLEIQKLCMTVYSLRLTVLTPVPDISSSWSTFVKHPGRTDCHTRDQHVNLWPAQICRHILNAQTPKPFSDRDSAYLSVCVWAYLTRLILFTFCFSESEHFVTVFRKVS